MRIELKRPRAGDEGTWMAKSSAVATRASVTSRKLSPRGKAWRPPRLVLGALDAGFAALLPSDALALRSVATSALAGFTTSRVTSPEGDPGKPYLPPSRKNRKSITTWQDDVVFKELRDISHETGNSQQVLIAEGLNYVPTKYRMCTAVTPG